MLNLEKQISVFGVKFDVEFNLQVVNFFIQYHFSKDLTRLYMYLPLFESPCFLSFMFN